MNCARCGLPRGHPRHGSPSDDEGAHEFTEKITIGAGRCDECHLAADRHRHGCSKGGVPPDVSEICEAATGTGGWACCCPQLLKARDLGKELGRLHALNMVAEEAQERGHAKDGQAIGLDSDPDAPQADYSLQAVLRAEATELRKLEEWIRSEARK